MKFMKYITVIGCISLWALSSCDEYEAVPIEKFTIDYVFSTTDSLGRKAEYYLNTIYYAMPNGHNRVGGNYLDAASDDAVSSAVSENDIQRLAAGQYTASSRVGVVTSIPSRIIGDMDWNGYYAAIRQAIIFVNNIDVVPLMYTFVDSAGDTVPTKRAWKAEARFLKAYYYFELVKRYGGVPILRDNAPYELGDDLELPRNSFEYCINYIVDELDAIKDSLRTVPLQSPGSDGHCVTQGAAMALKSRVLLYAASPLFNERPIESGNELIAYTQYDPQRWKTAADAARLFIETYNKTTPIVYALNTLNTPSTKGFVQLFLEYYSSGASGNREIIFAQQGSESTDIEKANGPVGFSGNNQSNGATSPTQNLVDAFPMLDGKAIDDPTSTYSYSVQNMYADRDPRLNYTILHNGSRWLKTDVETFLQGVNNPSQSTQTTKTSYYMRKFMGKFEEVENYSNTLHLWIMFRYAEILLNLAEAENEYSGPTQEVYDQLIALRKRAGIKAGDGNYGLKTGMTKDEMRQAIQNERRIEMAFEEQRYWDIRRWRIAEDVFAEPL
ncbi:MAG: RagB/SusD family nutrient uptake outer membrane protein, partial [Candidatus Symbiothrix sp.]|nr:RagB/SusD family nutrient uptake outer membrane protein [Candidatus Symbiothrix sp.]